MDVDKIVKIVKFKLIALSRDPRNVKDYSRFYKDGRVHLGINSALVRSVAWKEFLKAKTLDRDDILHACEELLRAAGLGYKTVAFDWSFRLRKQYRGSDIKMFERWIKRYVGAWDECDDLCTHALGEFIFRFPSQLPILIVWSKSKNEWLRRAAAVALIYSLRRGKCLNEAFEIASNLVNDKKDLVQKGYGWMLKEASKAFPKEVFAFVNKNKRLMSRVALRYAIEKLPAKMRKTAMTRN